MLIIDDITTVLFMSTNVETKFKQKSSILYFFKKSEYKLKN